MGGIDDAAYIKQFIAKVNDKLALALVTLDKNTKDIQELKTYIPKFESISLLADNIVGTNLALKREVESYRKAQKNLQDNIVIVHESLINLVKELRDFSKTVATQNQFLLLTKAIDELKNSPIVASMQASIAVLQNTLRDQINIGQGLRDHLEKGVTEAKAIAIKHYEQLDKKIDNNFTMSKNAVDRSNRNFINLKQLEKSLEGKL